MHVRWTASYGVVCVCVFECGVESIVRLSVLDGVEGEVCGCALDGAECV